MGEGVIRRIARYFYSALSRAYPDFVNQEVVRSKEYSGLSDNCGRLDADLEVARHNLSFQTTRADGLDDRVKELSDKVREAEGESVTLGEELSRSRGELGKAHETLASYENEMQRLRQELLRYDPVRVSGLERQLQDMTNLIAHLKRTISTQRRSYKLLKASERRNMHESCVADNNSRKEVVFVLNHAGRIAGMSPSAVKVYGDLRNKDYSVLIEGSETEKEQVSRYFNIGKPVTGWIYSATLKSSGRKEPSKIRIEPKFFKEIVDGNEQDVRHSTVITVLRRGYGFFSRKEICLQDGLRNLRSPEEVRAEVDCWMKEAEKSLQERGGNPFPGSPST